MNKAAVKTSFSSLLTECGLLSSDVLRNIKAQFPQESSTRRGLALLLMQHDLLTPWQLKKLIQGKHEGFVLGSYRLRSHLARGGMSSLYSAEHVTTGERRALKVLPPEKAKKHSYLPRFLREARLASTLRHKNIIRVFEVVRSDENQSPFNFMAMELLNGRDLYRLVSEEGPTSISEAAEIIRQAAIGLHHAHEEGLVHRDVKPRNIFLTNDGTVKIIDLGLAAVSEDFDENITRHFDETVIGTADYLAPEQAIDSHNTDHRADIYALGCTFYYLLSGQPPFARGSLVERILAHQIKTPRDVREFRTDVPDTICELLDKMLIKDRSERIQSAELVANQLVAWLKADTQSNTVPGDETPGTLNRFASTRHRQEAETQTEQPRRPHA